MISSEYYDRDENHDEKLLCLDRLEIMHRDEDRVQRNEEKERPFRCSGRIPRIILCSVASLSKKLRRLSFSKRELSDPIGLIPNR